MKVGSRLWLVTVQDPQRMVRDGFEPVFDRFIAQEQITGDGRL